MGSTVSRPARIAPIAKDAYKATHSRRDESSLSTAGNLVLRPTPGLLVEPERHIPFAHLPGLLCYAQGRFAAFLRMARLAASQARL